MRCSWCRLAMHRRTVHCSWHVHLLLKLLVADDRCSQEFKRILYAVGQKVTAFLFDLSLDGRGHDCSVLWVNPTLAQGYEHLSTLCCFALALLSLRAVRWFHIRLLLQTGQGLLITGRLTRPTIRGVEQGSPVQPHSSPCTSTSTPSSHPAGKPSLTNNAASRCDSFSSSDVRAAACISSCRRYPAHGSSSSPVALSRRTRRLPVDFIAPVATTSTVRFFVTLLAQHLQVLCVIGAAIRHFNDVMNLKL
jgi:hypothetical protein